MLLERLRVENIDFAMGLAELDLTPEEEHKLFLIQDYVEGVSRFSPRYCFLKLDCESTDLLNLV